jgi:hypothetical protein
MTEAVAASPDGELESLPVALAQLQANGAQGFDPVGFQYLAAMTRRALALPEPAATLVADKARTALHRFHSDFHRARERAEDDLERLAAAEPAAREALQGLLQSGDFRGLRRAAARLQGAGNAASPVELTRLLAADPAAQSAPGTLASAMAEQEQGTLGQAGGGTPAARAELKSFAPLRETLAAVATNRMLEREQGRKPADSGPLNPQMLALRSLESMRELSPAYLGRFVSYLDALFWLEKAAAGYSPPKP